ncbi:MAG: DNA mismatch repair protein MutS [Treponema sp.]|nr:DNA mismatch repair protein MutS [Treponema sp.]
MMEQYRRIKREHRGEVLFFRLGDFYEMFFEDALEVSALLNLTLTHRSGHPMCGIPYHAYRSYIARLLRLGKKVAVCEQIAESGKGSRASGPMERRVVEIITPGTTVDEDFLDKGSSNYLACLAATPGSFSFSYIDLSAGEFYATSFPADRAVGRLRQELERIQAREIIVQESILNEFPALAQAVEERSGLVVNRWADWLFDSARSRQRLEKQFGETRLKGFGIAPFSPEIISSGALLDYLDDTSRSLIPHVRFLKVYGESEFVGIDESTQRNLELVRNLSDGGIRFSLLEVMDESRTAMGRRLLKSRILHPLRNQELINRRLDMVESLYQKQEKLKDIRELLSKTPDLERLCSRLAMDRAHGKDMVAVKNALFSFEHIERLLGDGDGGFAYESAEAASLTEAEIAALQRLGEVLEQGLAESPSILLTEGNLIRDGYDQDLDRLKELRDSGRKLLEDYLEQERQITGIANLKIRYNRLIGYFFEVTQVNVPKVPPHFIRRQGMAGGERFTTDRLAALESDINSASDKIIERERKLFLEIRDKAKALLPELASAGRRIAEVDAAQSLARAAAVHAWTRPLVDGKNRTRIVEGRHPFVEAHLPRGEFIPNDVSLDARAAKGAESTVSFALITGPNMAGKSTYLRQTALITLMAQAGSFVPASEARIGMVDRIYCRVGASDNLARGESTFLVEMNETAYILHTATAQSLVIMDEVGRGTGTEDGLSIAWAVCEELLNNIQCRTLFATHYHELSKITHPRMANRSMDVAERDGQIVFLRKLREGPAAESYGLHVASLAGLGENVLRRAAELMAVSPARKGKTPPPPAALKGEARQSGFESKIISELAGMEADTLTPLEALNLIHRWKKLVQNAGKGKAGRLESGPPAGTRGEGPSLFD